jgi:polyhydroxybutyrate depolymerase
MKNLYITLVLCAFSLSSFAQLTTESWPFDGLTREYRQYVPSIYDGSEPVPLIISLHGLGDNIANFSQVGFHQVADTANVIVVTPQAILDALLSNATAWNSGAGLAGFSLNGDVEDVSFINALIDTVSAHYNIDQTRVYATGFSMGGFMSNRLACELNDRIAAIASVAGSVGGTLTCTPGQEVPVCHFHGTGDTQVGYGTAGGGVQDNSFGSNVTDWISLQGQFPNTAGDDRSVEYVEYAGCNAGSRVVHYKVNNADHEWLFTPNNDIFYTVEIWKFFLGLSPDNLVPAAISDQQVSTVGVYPNPATNVLRIENLESKVLNVSVFNTTGQLVKEFSNLNGSIDISDLYTGVYHIMIATEKGLFSNSFVKN